MGKPNLKVLIAAGGSGGHLFPAQQLALMLERKEAAEVHFAGYKLKESPFFLRSEGFKFTEIPASPWAKWSFLLHFLRGFYKSIRMLKQLQPDVVVGFGSYHAFAVLMAAAVLRKNIVLFEANSSFGKVIRLFKPFAKQIASQFPLKGANLVPMLPWISHHEKWDPEEARRSYGLDPHVTTFLVFGGSQGAHFLNSHIPEAFSHIQTKLQVLHLTGKVDAKVASDYEKLHIRAAVLPFEPQMAKAYAAADFAICRSGASTIAELIRYEIAALLIPFPKAAGSHQRKNGEYLYALGACRLLLQKQATSLRIVEELKALMQERLSKKLALQKLDLQMMNRIDFVDLICAIGDPS